MFATDSTTSKIMVAFDFDRLFDEGTMYMITPTEAGVNFNDLTGLIDVNFNNAVVTSNTLVADLALDYGTALSPIKFIGALPADFLLTVNGVSTPLGGALEGPDGTYTFTFTASTGDDVVITIDKLGYDGEYSFVAA
jgi:hypothetical protein